MSVASGEFDTRSSEEPEQPQKRIRLSPKASPSPAQSEGEVSSDSKGDSATSSPEKEDSSAPPLPDEEAPPPLPNEPLPTDRKEDDGWDPVWDDSAQAFYFYNRFTAVSQWDNPRVPDASPPTTATGLANHDRIAQASNGSTIAEPPPSSRPAGSYDPAIHGDYDPTAPYAQKADPTSALDPSTAPEDPNMIYTTTGAFNRFTGKWQAAGLTPDNFNDENKSKRQMNAFFDVDAAANSHDGKSLKAERSGKKLTKKEVKAFKDKRREKKEEKRRAWLRD